MQVTTSGQLVGFVNRPYSFTGDDGNPVTGTSRELYLFTAADQAPAKIKPSPGELPEDLATVREFEKLVDVPPFATLDLVVNVTKSGAFQLIAVTKVTPPKAA